MPLENLIPIILGAVILIVDGLTFWARKHLDEVDAALDYLEGGGGNGKA